nr:ATP synthase F0 subunit 8 [Bregmaceros japonicus]
MPQLKPDPWFLISMFVWFIFLVVMMTKMYTHTFSNKLPSYGVSAHHSAPWFWPWP